MWVAPAQVHDGYPTSFVTDVYQSLCVAWDPVTRLPRRNSSDIYPGYGQTVALGGRDFQMNFGYLVQNVYTGDYITVGLISLLIAVLPKAHICHSVRTRALPVPAVTPRERGRRCLIHAQLSSTELRP